VDLREQWSDDKGTLLRVAKVAPGGAFDRAGVRRGHVVVAVNGTCVVGETSATSTTPLTTAKGLIKSATVCSVVVAAFDDLPVRSSEFLLQTPALSPLSLTPTPTLTPTPAPAPALAVAASASPSWFGAAGETLAWRVNSFSHMLLSLRVKFFPLPRCKSPLSVRQLLSFFHVASSHFFLLFRHFHSEKRR
jgi:hypothetical protein